MKLLSQGASSGLVMAAALALAAPAWAQTPPKIQVPAKTQAKPAAAAPAQGDGKTLSGNTGGRGPILTKDELRACLTEQETLQTRTTEHVAARAPLDAEKETLSSQQAALRNERGSLDDLRKQADALSVRITEHTAKVEAWNKKVADFNAANKIGPEADRARRQINQERDEIDAASKALNDDRARLQTNTETAVAAFNAKATAMDARINDWNQRNQAWNDAGRELDATRKTWLANCGDRRYREDDEIAIKRGK